MKLFSALADGTRREIVKILAERGELPVAEISKNFTITAPAVSQHLKVLREAGVLSVRKQAQQRFYRIDEKGMEEVGGWLSEVREKWNARLNALDAHVMEMNQKEKK
ncbi:MAG: winged helix-turn-helix transcriptional regulator [Aridibacter famidurans]|nr:winged helix-turn-helix transcriptional regulator [Aridibacter famidurans]